MVVCGLLQENYGKADKDCVAKVKELYKDLNLEVLCHIVIRSLEIKKEYI